MPTDEQIASGVFELRADADQFVAVVANAGEVASRFERATVEAFNRAGKSTATIGEANIKSWVRETERLIQANERQAASSVLANSALQQLRAQGKGIAQEVYAPLVAALKASEDNLNNFNRAVDQAKNIHAFDSLLADSVKLQQVEKRTDALTAALERLSGEAREAANIKLSGARVDEGRAVEAARSAAESALIASQREIAASARFAEEYTDKLTQQLLELEATEAFDSLLADSVKLQQVGKNIDGLTNALDRLQAEEQQVAQTRVYEARVAEAAKLGQADVYIRRYAESGNNLIAAERAFAANSSFITALQRRSDAIGKSQSDILELEAAERGLSDRAAPFIKNLRDQEKALGIYSGASRDARVSTNQLRVAMQQLPAQFTDIFTSLAGGQNPLLVLIQQGGQIRDSFRGVDGALSQIGKSILAAFTPARLLIGGVTGAVGLFVAAVALAEKESAAYRRALALTGNAAGTTAGQMQTMAEAVSRSVGTQGQAAEAIAALAATGRVAGRDLGLLAEAAIRLEREGGPAVKDTVAAFAELGKAPTQGALKLNETTRFLTVSILEQIRALEEQGRVSDAARLAQTAFADEGIRRAKELESQLGTLQKAMRGVTDFAKGMWDAILDVGRAETVETRITNITKALEANARRTDRGNSRDTFGNVREGGDVQRQRLLDQLDDARLAQQATTNAAEVAAKGLGKADEAYEKAAKTIKKWGEESLTSSQKSAKAIQDYRKEVSTFNAKRQFEGLPGLSSADQAKQEEAIRKSFEKGNAAIKDRDSTLQSARDAAKAWASAIEDALKIEAEATGQTLELNKAQQSLVGYLTSPAYLQHNDQMRSIVVQYYANASAAIELGKAERERVKALEDYTKAVIANAAAMAKDEATADGELQRLRDEYIELSAGKAALESQVIARLELAAAMREQAAAQALIDGADDSGAVSASFSRQAQQLRDQISQRRRNALVDESNKAMEEAKKQAEAAADEWERTADDIRSSLTDAFRSAFESGESFGTAFAEVIERELKTRLASAVAAGLADLALYSLGISAVGATGGVTGQQGAAGYAQTAQALSTLYGYGKSAYGYIAGLGTTGGTLGASTSAYTALTTNQTLAAYGVEGAGSAAASSASGASSAGGLSYAGWAAIAAAIYLRGASDYEKGFDREAAKNTGTIAGRVTYDTSELLSKLGVSDKIADIFGATAVAATIGRAAPRVEAAGASGSFGAGGFSGNQFVDIIERGGFLRSDKKYSQISELPQELDRFFDDAAKAVFLKAKEFGAALGLPVEALEQVTTDIKIKLGDDAQENQVEIDKALNLYGDALVAGFADAVKPLAILVDGVAETTVQTITRVGSAITGVNQVLDALGVSALAASVDGGKAALALQDIFGGVEGLQQAAGGYLQEYYTDAERAALQTKALGKSLAEVGLELPTTREGFRDLVEAQDLSTESGRAAFATLLSVASAFDQVQDSAEALNAELTSAIEAALPRVLGKQSDPYAGIQSQLASAGVSLSLEQLTGATREDIYAFAESFLAVGENSHEAKLAVIAAAGALGDLLTASEELSDQTQERLREESIALSNAIDQVLPRLGRGLTQYESIQRRLVTAGVVLPLDQLIGASKDDIYAFAESFLQLKDVSNESKIAVVELAGELADLGTSIQQGLSSVIADFASPRELATFRASEIQPILAGGGINVTLEQVLGSTEADIVALWRSVGDEGKAAILAAYGAWQELRESVLQADIADIVGPLGTTADELLAAYQELNPAADGLVASWRKTRSEVENLSAALAEIDGTEAVSAIDKLRGLISQRNGLASLIGDNEDRIFDLRVGQGGAQAVSLLRQREAALWREFASTNSPEVAQAITETTLQRIALEGELQSGANEAQMDALREQISAAERLRDIAAQMGQFVLSLQAGNLSNLSYQGRLAASEQLFANSLLSGEDVQGNATSLLQNAQNAFGGATGAYSDVFDSVTGRLRDLGIQDFDSQISDAQAQLIALEGIGDTSEAQIAALTELNGRFGVGMDALNSSIAAQRKVLDDQLVAMKSVQTNQETQIRQFGEALDTLIKSTDRTADATEELADAGSLAGAQP